jgi:hypothetical protein
MLASREMRSCRTCGSLAVGARTIVRVRVGAARGRGRGRGRARG